MIEKLNLEEAAEKAGRPMKDLELESWIEFLRRLKNPTGKVRVALVGKYVEHQDAYKSISESFIIAGAAHSVQVEVMPIHSETVTRENVAEKLGDVSGILVAPDGERYIFPYFGTGLTDSAAGLELARVSSFDCVLTDARYPLMNEAVLKEAKRCGVPVVADFGNSSNWHLAAYADYLIVSEECARELLGGDPESTSIAELRQAEGQLIGVTLGENGFVYEHAGEFRHIPALPVAVVDTTGAGDVFHGAYAYAVARGWDVARCGLFASVTAALKCTALGGRTGIPTAAEVEHLLVEKTAREMDELQWT